MFFWETPDGSKEVIILRHVTFYSSLERPDYKSYKAFAVCVADGDLVYIPIHLFDTFHDQMRAWIIREHG